MIANNGTLPDVDGTIPEGTIVTLADPSANKTYYVANNSFGNSIVCDRFDSDTISGQLPGYHTVRSTDCFSARYALMEKHKVYKKFSSFMNEYRKHKRDYEIKIHDYFVMGNEVIQIKINTPISITFMNKKENKTEKICSLGDFSNDLLSTCVTKFLDKHGEEFMELIEEELKKDVKEYARQEGERMKESLELVDIIKNME